MSPFLSGSLKSIISCSRLHRGAVMKDLSRLERKPASCQVFTGPVQHEFLRRSQVHIKRIALKRSLQKLIQTKETVLLSLKQVPESFCYHFCSWDFGTACCELTLVVQLSNKYWRTNSVLEGTVPDLVASVLSHPSRKHQVSKNSIL